jgi:hypothetical protein
MYLSKSPKENIQTCNLILWYSFDVEVPEETIQIVEHSTLRR